MSVIFTEHPKPPSWPEFRAQWGGRWTTPFSPVTQWTGNWIAFLLGQWSLLPVLEYMGTLSLLVAVVHPRNLPDAPNRLEQKHSQAWQVINTAQGKWRERRGD